MASISAFDRRRLIAGILLPARTDAGSEMKACRSALRRILGNISGYVELASDLAADQVHRMALEAMIAKRCKALTCLGLITGH